MSDVESSASPPSHRFLPAVRVSDLPEEGGKAVKLEGRVIAIFRTQGQIYAIDDRCPHAGASLAPVQLVDGTVVCPWHAWRFRLCDGAWADHPKIKVQTYPVEVRDGIVYIGVPEEPS